MFLDELKQQIASREQSINELRQQVARLIAEKDVKESEIKKYKDEFAISLDQSVMDRIKTIEAEITDINSTLSPLQYAIGSKVFKAHFNGDIEEELESKLAEIKIEKKEQAVHEAINKLGNAINEFLEAKNAVEQIPSDLTIISEQVDGRDLKVIHKWYSNNKDKFTCEKEQLELLNNNVKLLNKAINVEYLTYSSVERIGQIAYKLEV